jgi:hypothetical protein
MGKESQTQISIIRTPSECFPGDFSGWTTIIDGQIADHLGWDEMLGQIAEYTLTGKIHYRGTTIGDLPNLSSWKAAPKQIAGFHQIITIPGKDL